jgi:hypothetical protein
MHKNVFVPAYKKNVLTHTTILSKREGCKLAGLTLRYLISLLVIIKVQLIKIHTSKRTHQKPYQSETGLFEMYRMVNQIQGSHCVQMPSRTPEVQTRY